MGEQRDAIVEALREAHGGLDAAELGRRLGLHPNTVRWHLGVLAGQGVITSGPERRGGRGRPTIVYRLTPDGAARDRDEYRLLAELLTATVAGMPDAGERSYATGAAWGRELAGGSEPALETVVDLLDDQGFAATTDGETIEMRRCPFWALAASSPEVVCTLHHGIIDGALEAAGGELAVDELLPFVEPTLCVARLRQTARSTAAQTKSSAR
jgi:predicted ArsR family transcriptional regulator